MTTALVKNRPWSLERARSGLVDRAIAAETVINGRTVRVLPEPLLRRGDDGTMLQSVRLLIGPLADPGRIATRGPAGTTVPVRTVPGPGESIRMLLPAVGETTPVTLLLPGLGSEAHIRFDQAPVREWEIHLVQHSHYDIGYTDPQGTVLREQLAFLDSCVDLARASRDRPKDSRFHWSVESLWTFAAWADSRPRAHVEVFADLVRAGQLELTALPYNLHMDTCSTDELHELLRLARDLRHRLGVEIVSAMQTDVPGQPVGLPAALAQQQVRYLSVAHNWAGRSVPHLIGGQHLPRLFRWQAPSGESVLVWMTDSPHGLAYNEGATVGFTSGYDTVDDLLPAYLTSLATQSYPYPPGSFGWHGPAVTDREPYAHDLLHLRVLGRPGDNAPATLLHADIADQWNRTWEFPKLRTSTNTAFFREAEERLGEEIPTLTGDWGDWWVEGVGSAAHPLAMTRRAQALATDTQVVSTVGRHLGGLAIPDEAERSRRLYSSISMFNEHTWGAMDPWRSADRGGSSGQEQWHWKYTRALEARDDAELLLDAVTAHVGAGLPADPGAVATYQVVNPTGLERSSTVTLFVRESMAALEADLVVRDSRTAAVLPSERVPQANPVHRAAGHFLRIGVPDIPPTGSVRLTVHHASDIGAEPGREQAADPAPAGGEIVTLENAHLRVEVDLRRSCLGSITAKASGRELVDQDAVVGMNAYLYDTYTTAGGYNHLSNKTEGSEELELLGSRSLGRPAVLLENVTTAVEQRVTYEFAADGADWVRVTLRLATDAAHLEIENRLSKPSTMTKESAFFAFPFAVLSPRTRYEITGGLVGTALADLPGAPQHMRAIRDWVTMEDDRIAIAWASADAPLIHPEVVALPYAPFPESMSPRQPGTVYSWVHNNIWDTNFPSQQSFETTFRYAIGVRRAQEEISTAALAMRTSAEIAHPPVGILATAPEGTTAPPPVSDPLIRTDDDRIRIVSLVTHDQGGPADVSHLLKLQSYAEEPVTVTLSPGFPVGAAFRATYLGDRREELDVSERGISVPLAALESTGVLLTRSRP